MQSERRNSDHLSMKTYRKSLALALSFQLALCPSLAIANTQPKTLTDQQRKEKFSQLRAAAFDYIANQFMMTTTAEHYEKWLTNNLSPSDREEAVGAFKTIKKIQVVKRSKETLIFEADGKILQVTWPDPAKPNFKFNGAQLNYDFKKPFKVQFEDLATKLSHKKNAFLQHLLPEAEAVAFLPILYGLAAVLGGALLNSFAGDAAKHARCYLTKGSAVDGQDCIDMRRAQTEASQAGMPAFDSVINLTGSNNSNVLSRFEGNDRQCPSNNDGKDRFYRGMVRTVRVENGVKTPSSDYVFTIVKFTAAGVPTDMIITKDFGDMNPADSGSQTNAKRLIAHIAFDPTTRRPVSYRIPNPVTPSDSAAGILHSPTLNLNLNMNLTPEQKDMISNTADIVRFSIYRVYNCVAQDTVAEQQAGIESGSPGAPKAPVPPTPPATTQ